MTQKTQKLITGRWLNKWDSEVTEHLDGGWRIIPNTLQICPAHPDDSNGNGIFVVGVEYDENVDEN